MQRVHPSQRLIFSAIAGLLLVGCAGSPASLTIRQGMSPAHGKWGRSPHGPVGANLLPAQEANRAFVATTGGGSLTGTVAFQAVSNPFFANNAANYNVLSAMPSANAIITLSTLDENMLTLNGAAITATSDGNGKFTLTGSAPTDRPYVVSATLVQSHQLSALVPKGATSATLDEASSMITEMARWQMRDTTPSPNPYASETTLADLDATTLGTLYQNSRSVLNPADFTPVGTIPSIDALKIGAGHLLRNLYVTAFGAKVTSDPASTAAPDVLSDTWKKLLDFRPLALTRLAGNGVQGGSGNVEGQAPQNVTLGTPIDAVADANGDLYISEQDTNLIRYIPKTTPATAPYGYQGTMTAGNIYTIAGAINGPGTLQDFDSYAGQVQDASGAMPAGSFIYSPYRIVLGTGSPPDIYFTSNFGSRVMMIPASNETLFGRTLIAGKIYTIAGSGIPGFSQSAYNTNVAPIEDPAPVEDPNLVVDPTASPTVGLRFLYNIGDGGPAYQANLSLPTGLAQDGSGNLFFLDTKTVSSAEVSKGMDYASATEDPLATTYSANTNYVPGAYTSSDPPRYYFTYHGTIRIVSKATGKIFSQKIQVFGSPLPLENANDLRISPDGLWLYVADAGDDVIFKLPMPTTDAASHVGIDNWTVNPNPVDIASSVVLGNPGVPGFIDTNQTLYPEVFDASQGMNPALALLNAPSSIDFDHDGNLVIADSGNGRIRVLGTNGSLYTIAGGLDTTYLSGDARLAYFAQLSYLNLMPGSLPNFLVVDRKENVVDTLWTGRGTF